MLEWSDNIQTWEETAGKCNIFVNTNISYTQAKLTLGKQVVYLCYEKKVQVLSCVTKKAHLLPRKVEEKAIKAKFASLTLEIRECSFQ